MKTEYISYNFISVMVFVGIIIVAHVFAHSGYSWRINTVSELAAQGYSKKWIMQVGFILLGLILLLGIVNKIRLGTLDFMVDIPIAIYGLAILVSGIFCTKPFISDIEYSVIESDIHSISATIAGIAFSIGILVSGIKETELSIRLIHFGFLIFVMGMSAYFGVSQSNNGLIQKLMYFGSFYWLVKYYN